MAVYTYDPSQVLVIIGSAAMGGFADGTFVSVERVKPYDKVTGADGRTSRSRNPDRSATLTLTLLQTSPSNDVLSGYMLADEANDAGVMPVMIKDNSGSTLIASGSGWVSKIPTVEYGKEIMEREWEIEMADCDFFVGGNG